MKKSVLAFVAVILMLSVASSSFAGSASDLTWGMSKDEVVDILGMYPEISETSIPGSTAVFYPKMEISKFQMTLLLAFNQDSLYAKVYFSNDEEHEIYDYLGEALDIKYGASAENYEVMAEVFSKIYATEATETQIRQLVESGRYSFKMWIQEDGTVIEVSWLNTGRTTLVYYYPEGAAMKEEYNFTGL